MVTLRPGKKQGGGGSCIAGDRDLHAKRAALAFPVADYAAVHGLIAALCPGQRLVRARMYHYMLVPILCKARYQPLAEVESGVPQIPVDLFRNFPVLAPLGFRSPDNVIAPALHRGILLTQNRGVPGHVIHGPRHDNRRVAPSRRRRRPAVAELPPRDFCQRWIKADVRDRDCDY